jgi:exopolysaccharide biosynthesis protein
MKLATTVLLLVASPLFAATWTLVESAPKPAPDGLTFREARASDGATEATIFQVSFAPKTHAFAVMDNPDGTFDLGSACAKRGALAGVNGGYFTPDRTPLGLVIRQGVPIHPVERGKLISGIISVTPGAIAIQRATAFKPSPAIREALQAGPFLVEGGKTIAGLNATKGAARTVVFQDAKGHAGFLICKSVSLAEMAEILATPAIFPDGKITRALNLDGGSSTALWVRGEPPFYQREWKSVRNYLAIVSRQ